MVFQSSVIFVAMMRCTSMGEIEQDLTKMKKNFTYKALYVDLETFYHFPEFFQVWKTGGEISSLFKNSRLLELCVLEIEVVSYFWLF